MNEADTRTEWLRFEQGAVVMWRETTLGEMCKMYQPKTISAKEMKEDGEYQVYGANGVIGKYDEYNHEHPQLLVTCRGATCGAVNVSQPFSWINGNAMVIQPNTEEVSLRYMEFLFRGGIDLTKAITGAAQPQITRKSLEPIKFSYPPLAEQKRIVAKLDAAFAEIDRATSTAEKKKARMSLVFRRFLLDEFNNLAANAPKYTLKEVSDDFGRGKSKHRPRNDERLYGDEMPFIQTGDVSNADVYVNSYSKKYSDFGIKQSKVWEAGTVCITIAANIAEIAILDIQACFPDSVIGVVPNNDKTTPKYVYYLLSNFQSYIKSKSKGSAQQNINLGTFENERFTFPQNIDEQIDMVDKLDAMYEHCESYASIQQSKIELFYALKSALLTAELTQLSEAA